MENGGLPMSIANRLYSYPIQPIGIISNGFLQLDINNFYEAAKYIQSLPYGRNQQNDFRLVLAEQRGTCSTKHALLAQLAKELNLPIHLVIGIYEMSEKNTPKVGAILNKYKLRSIPEAHCYLLYQDERLDFTQTESSKESPFDSLLYEEKIEPDHIGTYKRDLHQQFLDKWVIREGWTPQMTRSACWNIREECIAVLSQDEKTR